ncbi:MAG: hypothetical protein AAGK37_14310 [Pseudomonadota bacterium]
MAKTDAMPERAVVFRAMAPHLSESNRYIVTELNPPILNLLMEEPAPQGGVPGRLEKIIDRVEAGPVQGPKRSACCPRGSLGAAQ